MSLKFMAKSVNIFLRISLNICFGYSKEPSGSEITPCIKIHKPLVVYSFSGTCNIMKLSHNNVAYLWQNLDVFTPKM